MYSKTKCNIRDINSSRHRQSAHKSIATSFSAHASVTSSHHTRTHISTCPANCNRKYTHIPIINFITRLLHSTEVTITITEPPIRYKNGMSVNIRLQPFHKTNAEFEYINPPQS